MVAIAVLLTGRGGQTNNTNPPQQASGRTDVRVYYISLNNVIGTVSVVGCNDGLVERLVSVEGKELTLEEAYKQELALPTNPQEPSIYNALSRSTLEFRSGRIEGGTAQVELSGTLIAGDNCDKARIRAQLEYPALQVEGVDSVVVRINGYLLEELF